MSNTELRSQIPPVVSDLGLPVGVPGLKIAGNRFVVSSIIIDTNVGLVTGKGNSTLLLARHAARVEQASPEEDPIKHVLAPTQPTAFTANQKATYQLKKLSQSNRPCHLPILTPFNHIPCVPG